MKATNNSTNTLFMEIFVELLEIARAYFQELFKNEKPGVYTLKDVYAYIANCESLETKQGKAERLTEKEKEQVTKILHKSPYYSNIDSFFINSVSYVCKVSNNIVSIEKDNFKCSFDIVKVFECRYNDFNKNVNIEGVYPILYKELKLTVKDDKQFTKDLKTISKVSEFVSFEIEKGSDRLRVNYITELGISDTENKYGELFVQLSEPSNFSYRSDNRLSKVLSCLDGWNGEIYFTKEYGYCKLSFVSDNCDNCFMIDNKINYFNSIRDKNDYFPDKLTSVYCGKETKEPDTDIKPVGTSENKNDTNLQESKESATNKVFFFMEKDGYHWEQPNAQTFHLFKNGKEKVFKNELEAYNFVQNKENESYFDFNVSDYTDDMLEVTGLNLESIISKVKQDSPKELKVIQDIKLYDKTGKIVFTYGDGNTNTIIETTFNGDSVLQSVLQKINESM